MLLCQFTKRQNFLEEYVVSECMLLVGTIVLVATITSAVFVLQVQRRYFMMRSARQVEWENTQKRSLQIWEIQQEKRAIELENSLAARVQRIEIAWKVWEAKDTSLIASIAQCSNATQLHTKLEKEVVRLPHTDEVPLEKLD